MSALRPRANIKAVSAVDDDADRGDDDHRRAVGRRRIEQPPDRLRDDRPDRDQQEQGIDQRGEDRRLLQTVGEARREARLAITVPAQADHQPEHVGQIVAGVGQQRHRIGEEAEHRFGDDEGEVERDPDRERAAEIGRRMRVPVIVAVRVTGAHRRALAERGAPVSNSQARS